MRYDVAIVGGGIVGLGTAMALAERTRASLIVLEAEDRLAAHQTGHNSGVIHSGLYYRPGSLKARLCTEGREALYRFCVEHRVAHERCGKVVVAVDGSETATLEALEQRGRANGLGGLRRLGPGDLRDHEPHVRGVAGLLVPDTGIVDFRAVARAYAAVVQNAGHEVRTGARLLEVGGGDERMTLRTTAGEIACAHLVNCAGLQADRVARLCGARSGLRIVPFRGEYYELLPQRRSLVRNLIYPVPDPRFPFLGVHFTRMIDGSVEAGPNAVLAFAREGYGRLDFSARDAWEIASYRGFRRLARRHWRMALSELRRSWSKRTFLRSLQRLIPELGVEDIVRGGAGVRAQAVEPDGALVDDFRIVEHGRSVHVLNAPSPAATASIAIGNHIATLIVDRFGLR